MHKIDGAGHLNNTFVNENPAIGRAPTLVTPEWLNAVQGEISDVITGAGIALNKNDNGQLNKALAALQRQQTYTSFNTGGVAPAFTGAVTPAATAYATGQRFHVRFHAGVTGASTINLNGLGARSLKQYDYNGAKVNAVIAANQFVDVEYDGVDFLLLDPLPGFSVQPGEVQFFAMSTAPTGYLKANGAAVSRTTYAALFAAINTIFGAGDGATTFNLPDLRGEFLRGFDDGRGIDSGRSLGSTQAHALQNITGSFEASWSGDHAVIGNPTGAFYSAFMAERGDVPAYVGGGLTTSRAGFDASRVVNTATETRPRNVALLACIKF